MIKRIKKLFQFLSDKWFSFSKKRRTFLTISFSLIFILLIGPIFVNANGLTDALGQVLTGIVLFFVDIMGTLVTIEMKIMIYLAQWRSFTKGVFAVEQGWIIVRDMCNMFFILILLVISFSTILKIESYAYKKWLAKLVLFAIVINFSKTITGLLIDFSQVIMLTFVSSFQAATAGNIAQGLHLNEFLKADKSGGLTDNTGSWEILGASVLALILMFIFGIVMLIMIVMLMGRIVTLWVLTILSPLAYLLQASPVGTKYANQWWEEFSKNLISGPVLAFFLWLALYTIQNASQASLNAATSTTANTPTFSLLKSVNPDGGPAPDDDGNKLANQGVGTGTGTSATGTEVGKASVLLDFIVVIALLMAAIKVAQSLGVMGSQFAGQMMGVAEKVIRAPLKAGVGLLKYTDRNTISKLGFGYYAGKMTLQGWKDSFADKKERDLLKIKQNAAGRTGAGRVLFGGPAGKDYADRYGKGFLAWRGILNAAGDITHGAGYQAAQAKKLEAAEKEKQRLEDLKNNLGGDGVVFSEDEKGEREGEKDKLIEALEDLKNALKESVRDKEIEETQIEMSKLEDSDPRKKQLAEKLVELEDQKSLDKKLKEAYTEKEKIEFYKLDPDADQEDLDAQLVIANSVIGRLENSKKLESDEEMKKRLNDQIKKLSDGKIGKSKEEKEKIDQEIAEKKVQLEQLESLNERVQTLKDEKSTIPLFDIESGDFEAVSKLQYEQEIERIDSNETLSWTQKKEQKQDVKGDYRRKMEVFEMLKKTQKDDASGINKRYNDGVKEIENNSDLSDEEKQRRIKKLGEQRDKEIYNSKNKIRDFVKSRTRIIAPDDIVESLEQQKIYEMSLIPEYTAGERQKKETEIRDSYDKKKRQKQSKRDSIMSDYEDKKRQIEETTGDDSEKRIKLIALEADRDKKLKKAKVTEEEITAYNSEMDEAAEDEISQIGSGKRKRVERSYNEKINRYKEYRAQQEEYKRQEQAHLMAEYNAQKNKIKDGSGSESDKSKKLDDLLKAFKEKIKKANFDFDLKISNFGNKVSGNISREDFIKGIDKQIASTKVQMNKYKNRISRYTMAGTGVRTAHRELVDKKAKELSGIENKDELIRAFRNAMSSGDKYMAIAATEKLAKDANLNELLQEYGYDSTGVGQTKFFRDIFGKKFHMNEQSYLSAQNDVSYVAESAGHWDQARTVRVKPDGKFECMIKTTGKKDSNGDDIYDDSDHALECFADIMKMDPQVIARNLNRLAYGGESADTGKFHLSTLGAMLVKALGNNAEFMEKHSPRWNINITENLSQEMDLIKKILADNPDGLEKTIKALGRSSGTALTGKISSPAKIIEDVRKAMEGRMNEK